MSINPENTQKLFNLRNSLPEGPAREGFEAKVQEALKSLNPEQAALDLLQATNPTESPNDSIDKDPKLSVPYPLRNVLGITEEELPPTEIQSMLEKRRNGLWSAFNFPDIALLKPGEQTQYLNKLIETLKSQNIPVDLKYSTIYFEKNTSTLTEDEYGDCSISVQMNHPQIGNDALKVISNIQGLLISRQRIKEAKTEIRQVPSSPQRIQQIVERANQANLVDKIIMQSTVNNNINPLPINEVLTNISKTLEYNQWQIFNTNGAVQKYGQSIETQE